MLTLINELLAITHTKLLFEDLGNLKTLKLGRMINALKQSYAFYNSSYRNNEHVGNKINSNLYIGANSVIHDVPSIKEFADIRKVYTKTHEGCRAMALYANGEAFAFIIGDEVTKPSLNMAIAYDFSKLPLPPEKHAELAKTLGVDGKDYNKHSDKVPSKSTHQQANIERVSSWDKKRVYDHDKKELPPHKDRVVTNFDKWEKDVRKAAYNFETIKSDNRILARDKKTNKLLGEFDKDKSTGYVRDYGDDQFNPDIENVIHELKNFEGLTVNVGQLRNFINAICADLKGIKITGKAVMFDADSNNLRQKRYQNHPIAPEDFKLFADDLRVRLAKYKNSKLVTVADAVEFLEVMMTGRMQKINLGGATYIAKVGDTDSSMGRAMLAGKKFTLSFSPDTTTSGYSSLYIDVKMINNVLTPIQARYNENGKSVTKDL